MIFNAYMRKVLDMSSCDGPAATAPRGRRWERDSKWKPAVCDLEELGFLTVTTWGVSILLSWRRL